MVACECKTQAPPVMIIIDSDDDSDGRACCVILKAQTGNTGVALHCQNGKMHHHEKYIYNMCIGGAGAGERGKEEESVEMMKEVTEESLQILRRARKRRRKEMQAIVPATT
jgi:hypothetical protein